MLIITLNQKIIRCILLIQSIFALHNFHFPRVYISYGYMAIFENDQLYNKTMVL